MEVYIGIDPGATGAIGVLKIVPEIGAEIAEVYDYPGDEFLLAEMARSGPLFGLNPVAVVIEAQQAMPKQGVSSMFALGENYGTWRTFCAMLGWRVSRIRASVWKKGAGYPVGDYDASKKHSLYLARSLYPGMVQQLARVKDNGRAEALLLARYAWLGKIQ